MKQLINFSPAFVPGAAGQGYLDFSAMDPEFEINQLYAVINVTRNVILYAPGAAGMGGTTTSTNFGTTTAFPAQTNSILTLSMDTSTYSANDQLNVFYDVSAGKQGPTGSNAPMERGGMLEAMYILQAQILTELRVQNDLLHEGFFGQLQGSMRQDLNALRDDETRPAQILTNSGVGS